ncbi:MAG: glycosyl hydrolase family 65 protein [Brachybacterium sp.]|nr:glycosyl hydrolase family 65 protein [Brachybacterium sp.]
MRRISEDPVDRSHLPVDEWKLIESRPGGDLGVLETLFATANGYLGIRGTPPEGRNAAEHGTYINGFHETWPISHAESAFGFAETGQTMVNVPDATVMKLYVDDEPLLLSIADLEEYERWIDFREGVLRRELIWRTPSGARVKVRSSRMVSFTQRHLALMDLEVTMLDGEAPVVISSQIINRQDTADDFGHVSGTTAAGSGDQNTSESTKDPRRTTHFSGRVLEPRGDWHSERRMLLGFRTASSGMTLAVGAEHEVDSDLEVERLISTSPDLGRQVVRTQMTAGSTVRVRKAVTYHSSRSVSHDELFNRCRRTLDRVRETGFDRLVDEQSEYLAGYWERTDVRIADRPAEQQATRWCLFQLAQAAARSDQWGIPAKGLTGSGYEGHYFWDTDVYVAPFLTFTTPQWARNALRFRVNLLPKARERARQMNQRGALFPWRTINGEEASAYYAAGTAQYHIDADIAYAIATYDDVTHDEGFMRRYGTEVLVETARLWADLGFWRHNAHSSFHIHGVTGPDEYTTVVNNNMFTNVMARFNLRRAAEAVLDLQQHDPSGYRHLVEDVDLDPREPAGWLACADGMSIPVDETFGIHPQDDRFLEREVWDLSRTPEETLPLLLHYHPLVIYRFQVLKQADVVLALFLRGAEFTREEKRADFEYYDPITTGDSSLSAVVQSIIAAEVGHQGVALEYFLAGLYVDLGDLHENTSDGVHIASAGGVWNSLVHGFGGMRHERGRISFDPRLPAQWPELEFPLTVRDSRFRVLLRREQIHFTLETGDEVEVDVRGQTVRVTADGVTVPLEDQGPVLDTRDFTAPPGVGDYRSDGSLVTSDVPDLSSPWEFPVETDPTD